MNAFRTFMKLGELPDGTIAGMFKGFRELLNKQGIDIKLSDEAKHLLAHKGFNPKYGARQVAGTIRNYLRRPISRLIIGGKLSKGDVLEVGINEDKDLTFELITK